ncbi:MAG: MFS transporter [Bryobacteraceae bacterium]
MSSEAARLRWWLAWTLFLSTAINYIHRQTLSVLAPVITREFHLSATEYAWIVSAFQIAYAVMWVGGGVLLDLIGTRLGLAVAVIWWSAAHILTGIANSVAALGLFRGLLGVGEGCNWPGANKAVAESFPARERGLATALYDSGSSVGAIVAAPLISMLAIHFGWRWSFALTGLLGFAWLALWLAVSRSGGRSRGEWVRPDGRRMLSVLRMREVWGIMLGRSFTDPVWWFYVFWVPKYFSDSRGFSLREIGMFTWIPFVAAAAGNFAGGWASGFLIRRGKPVPAARKWVCLVSSAPMLAGIWVGLVSGPYVALALISLATFGYAAWSTMGLTFSADLFPPELVATTTGLGGFAAGLAGTLFTLVVGVLVDRFSYVPAFAAAGALPLLGTASVWLLIGDRAGVGR